MGLFDLGNRQRPVYFFCVSKTLDYPKERRRRHAHHKFLGRKFHAGLMLPQGGIALPYFGIELETSDMLVLMSDWISGDEGSITLGFEYLLWDKKTLIHPALFFSNAAHRIDGFLLNISREFNF